MDLTGPNGGTTIVYMISDLLTGEAVYAGSGKPARAIDHLFPSSKVAKYIRHGNYAIDVLWDGNDDRIALAMESVLIFAHRPTLNKQRFGTRGGRPKGVRATKVQRARASEMAKGKTGIWMKGRVPWNKGLTKNDHPGLKAAAEAKIGNRNGALKRGQKKRPTGKPAWNRGLTKDTSEAMKRIGDAQRGRKHSPEERAKNARALKKARAVRRRNL